MSTNTDIINRGLTLQNLYKSTLKPLCIVKIPTLLLRTFVNIYIVGLYCNNI